METPNSKYPRLSSQQLSDMSREEFRKYNKDIEAYTKEYDRWQLGIQCEKAMFFRAKCKEIYPLAVEISREYLGKKLFKADRKFSKIGNEFDDRIRQLHCEGIHVYLSFKYTTLYLTINGETICLGSIEDNVLVYLQVSISETFLESWMNLWNLVTTPEIIEELEERVALLDREYRDAKNLLEKHKSY